MQQLVEEDTERTELEIHREIRTQHEEVLVSLTRNRQDQFQVSVFDIQDGKDEMVSYKYPLYGVARYYFEEACQYFKNADVDTSEQSSPAGW